MHTSPPLTIRAAEPELDSIDQPDAVCELVGRKHTQNCLFSAFAHIISLAARHSEPRALAVRDGWMDGCMDVWMNEWMDGWMDELIGELID